MWEKTDAFFVTGISASDKKQLSEIRKFVNFDICVNFHNSTEGSLSNCYYIVSVVFYVSG